MSDVYIFVISLGYDCDRLKNRSKVQIQRGYDFDVSIIRKIDILVSAIHVSTLGLSLLQAKFNFQVLIPFLTYVH